MIVPFFILHEMYILAVTEHHWNVTALRWHVATTQVEWLLDVLNSAEDCITEPYPDTLLGVPVTFYRDHELGEMQGYLAILDNGQTNDWLVLTDNKIEVVPHGAIPL